MERCEYEDEMRKRLGGLHGIHVGLLDEHEMEAFDYLCEKGVARRVYTGPTGFMGLAKVDLHPPHPEDHG